MEHFLILSETNSINVCDNCFHLQKSEMLDDNFIKLSHYNEEMFMKFIFNSIGNYKSEKKIKILNINDNDINLLDTLYTNIINFKGVPKTYINTVSISLNFRPSYFSKHKCYRDILSESSIEYLKSNYNSFDIIILNTTLLTSKDPNKILTMCKTLCNVNTNIFVINYHSVDPIDYLMVDKYIKNLFTTNSLKRLCTNNDFEIDDLCIEKNYVFYKINYSKRDSISSSIVSTLYEEMITDIYQIDRYYDINRDWYNTLFETNKILDRYKLNKYEVVYISLCRCCIGEVYNNNKINYKINDLTKLNNILKDNNKYIFIIFNLDNQIVNDLRGNLKRNLKDNIKCLIYDIRNLITHPINFCD